MISFTSWVCLHAVIAIPKGHLAPNYRICSYLKCVFSFALLINVKSKMVFVVNREGCANQDKKLFFFLIIQKKETFFLCYFLGRLFYFIFWLSHIFLPKRCCFLRFFAFRTRKSFYENTCAREGGLCMIQCIQRLKSVPLIKIETHWIHDDETGRGGGYRDRATKKS